MKAKWIKTLVLTVLIMVLLIVGITRPGTGPATTPDVTVNPTVDPSAPTQAGQEGETLPVMNPTAQPAPTASADGGWVEQDGKRYYYLNGVLQTNTIVGSDTAGYYYVDANGVNDPGYCDGLTIDGEDWNIINGVATKSVNEWDDCLHSALIDIGKCTDSSMSKEEKLRAGFDYIKDDSHYLEGVLHEPPYNEMDWPVVCANDLFKEGMGDCFSYGAAFAFYGKACGFENCYACNTGGHGWAEIDGKAYDAEWDMHHQEYNHFGVSPEDDCDVAYFTSITEGVDWMYIQV